MKKFNKKGWIAIEYIIIAGLAITIGALAAPKVLNMGNRLLKDRETTTDEHKYNLDPSSDNIVATGPSQGTNTIPQAPDEIIEPGSGEIIDYPIGDGLVHVTSVEIKEANQTDDQYSASQITVEMYPGETMNFLVRINPANASNKKVRWVNYNEDIARASQNGLVQAIKPGEAIIKVEAVDNNVSNTIKVIVKDIYPTSITVSPNPMKMAAGSTSGTQQINVEFYPENTTYKACTYTSGDPSIVTVTNTGLATAASNVSKSNNKTTITVECSGNVDTIDVEVTDYMIETTGIELSPLNIQLEVGQTQQLTATVVPSDATIKTLEYESSDPTIATVSDTGLITAVKPGQIYVYVKNYGGDFYGKEIVNAALVKVVPVTVPVTGLAISYTHDTIEVGNSMSPVITWTPDNTTQKGLTWTSSDPSKLLVNEGSGQVKALESSGGSKVTVTATSTSNPSVSATFQFTVTGSKTHVTGLTIEPEILEVGKNKTANLIAAVTPSNATDKSVVWETSDPSVATVSSTGVVTGVNSGNCIITAKTVDGGYTDYANVVVSDIPVASIDLSETEITIHLNETRQLTATVNPSNATDPKVSWSYVSMSGESTGVDGIITVENGLVTGKSYGDVKVRASTLNGVYADCIVHVVPNYATDINLDTTEVVLEKGGTKKVNATVVPSDTDNKSLVWESTNESIATVDQNGNITASTDNHGHVQVKVTWKAPSDSGLSDITKIIEVTVNPTLVTQIDAIDSTSLALGSTIIAGTDPNDAIYIKVYPNTPDADNENLAFTSSDPSIFTVDESGTIVGVGEGTATLRISATDGSGKYKDVEITVTAEYIGLSRIYTNEPKEIVLELGRPGKNTYQPVILFDPATATNKNLKWTSADPNIATVNDDGLITGVALGETTVIVEAQLDNCNADPAVNPDGCNQWIIFDVKVVGVDVSSISVVPTVLSVVANNTYTQISVKILPNDASNMNWYYEVLDKDGNALSEGVDGYSIVSVDGQDEEGNSISTPSIRGIVPGEYTIRFRPIGKPTLSADLKLTILKNGKWDGQIATDSEIEVVDGWCIIDRPQALAWVKVKQDSGGLNDKCPNGIKQTEDIDMNLGEMSSSILTPEELWFGNIGAENPFSTVYDGQGHKIMNVGQVDACGSTHGAGLFAAMNNATVRSLTIQNSTFTKGNLTNCNVGTLAGVANNSTIEHVKIDNSIIADGDLGTGGVFGKLEGTNTVRAIEITGSKISGLDGSHVGGVVGDNSNSNALSSIEVINTSMNENSKAVDTGLVMGLTGSVMINELLLNKAIMPPTSKGKTCISGNTTEPNENVQNSMVSDSGDVVISCVKPEAIYWGVDASNKLIISDQPVASATENRAGSFAKTATFSYTGGGTSTVTTAPWGTYADAITGIEVTKVNENVAPISTAYWFAGLKNVECVDATNLDTSKVTDMTSMFNNAGYNVTGSFTITGMYNWNVSNVTNMSQMFSRAGYNATTWSIGDISNWNTSNVTTMASMFSGAGKNATAWSIGDISNWNTSNVTTMASMFSSAGQNATTFDLGDLSTKTVTVGDNTYIAWNVENVTNMSGMFKSAGEKATTWNIGNISNWNTGEVTTMSSMLENTGYSATTWNIGDLSTKTVTVGDNTYIAWNTGNVTNMSFMFSGAGRSATIWSIGDLGNWDTSSVKDVSYMFSSAGQNATTFDLGDLSTKTVTVGDNTYTAWDTSKVTTMSNMFNSAGYSATTWNIGNISNWNTGSVTNMQYMFKYAGKNATTFDIGDLSTKEVTVGEQTYTAWNVSKVTDMLYMFSDAGQNAATWDIGDLSNWNTSNVTNMSYMFSWAGKNATAWNIGDISNWNTSKVTNMNGMFSYAGYKAAIWNIGDLSTKTVTVGGNTYTAWDVSNVKNMVSMFLATGYNVTTFDVGNIGNWNTSNVANMSSMFAYAGQNATTWSIGDISNWNTSKVTSLYQMFYYAGQNAITELDLSGWDATKVTTMAKMFNRINKLETIKTPKNIQSSVTLTSITSKTFYDITDNNTEYVAGTFPVGNGDVSHTLTSIQKYNVTLHYEDGITPSETVWANEVSQLPVPTREGYDFVGWYTGAPTTIQYLTFSNPNSDYPWKQYSDGVWISGNAGVNDSTSDMISNEFTIVNNGTLSFEWRSNGESYYDYLGYDIYDVINGKYLSGNASPTYSNCLENLKSKGSTYYTTMSYDLPAGTYQLLFMYGKNGSTNKKEDKGFVKNIKVKQDVIYETAIEGEIANDMVAVAKWEPKIYTITYILNGGLFKTEVTTEYTIEDTITLPGQQNVDKNSYTFSGWYDNESLNGEPVDTISAGSTGNRIYYAKWDKAYYWGVDSTNKLIISDEPVTSATENRAGSFIKTASFSYTGGSGTSAKTTAPWGTYADVITSIEVIKVNESVAPISTKGWFAGLKKVTYIDLSKLDTSSVTNMSNMFNDTGYSATTFELDISSWNTSSVTDMSSMFYRTGYGATTFKLDISSLDTSKVTNMSSMFYSAGYHATTWEIDLSGWNTSSVTNMKGMFNSAGFNATTWTLDLSSWDTSKVTDMSYMFYRTGYCTANWTLDLSGWNTSSVTNMTNMFYYAGYKATTWNVGNLSGWDTSKVTDMSYMFNYAGYSATIWTLDLSSWDIRSVTNIRNMFDSAGYKATTWEIDLNGWNASSVKNMIQMFRMAGYKATTWTLDLSSWDISSVTSMEDIFFCAGYSATNWTLDISNWDTSSVTNMEGMFHSAGFNATTWTLDLSSWDTSSVTNMGSMFTEAGYSATTWTVGDISNWDTSKVTNMRQMFYRAGYKVTDWTLDLSGWNTSSLKIMSNMFLEAGYSATTWTLDLSGWNTSSVTNMSGMFESAGYSATTWILDLNSWNTSSVTDMSYMFNRAGYSATTWIFDLSKWDTSSVTNMSHMFENAGYKATTWDLDISSWNTGSVTNMSYMFKYAGSKATTWNLDISSWDTRSVTNMSYMFSRAGYDVTTWTLDLSGWNTSSVTNMSSMFESAGYNASIWTVGDISNWDTSSVTNMSSMFSRAGYSTTTFKLDISSWDTSSVTNMRYMFESAGVNAITEINLSGWDATKVTDMSYMFKGITSLQTIKTPKNIQASTKITDITSKTFYDTADNNKEYVAGTFPTGNTTSITLTAQ